MGATIYTASAVVLWCLLARLVSSHGFTGFFDDTFEGRLSMHSQWVSDLENKGRNLAWSPSEAPKPDPDPKPIGPAPKPGGPKPRIQTNGTFPMTGYGYCKVLRYQSGYADLDLSYDTVIADSPNFGECCKSCQNDPKCFAWTRVAGGDGANFRNCYLMYNADGQGSPGLRHVSGDIILESGTKPDVFPANSYGCPYSAVATTPCPVPDGCNVGPDGQSTGPCL